MYSYVDRLQVEPEAAEAVLPTSRTQGLAAVAEDILSCGVDSGQPPARNPTLQQLF